MKALLLVLFVLSLIISNAQEIDKDIPVKVNCDLWSRYLWRGTDYGASPSIQPYMSYSKNGFKIGFWGAYTINKSDFQEADFYISYTFKKKLFTVLITDYYFPNESTNIGNYFEYNSDITGHLYELTIKYNGIKKFPLSFMLASNVYGADAYYLNSDGTAGEIMYSTYAELTYTFNNLSVFSGFSFMDPDESTGEIGFYGNSYGFVNIGCTAKKIISLNEKYSIPLNVSFVINPMSEKIFLVAGITF